MKKKLNCVLLIDDDEATNFINSIVIKRAGITNHIEIALNGIEAIEYLTNSGKHVKTESTYPQPSLIFLDINMPVMDGWEFIQAYQNLEINQKGEIIIVMLTTSLNPDDQKRANQIPELSDFKSKPLTSKIINEVLEKHFDNYL